MENKWIQLVVARDPSGCISLYKAPFNELDVGDEVIARVDGKETRLRVLMVDNYSIREKVVEVAGAFGISGQIEPVLEKVVHYKLAFKGDELDV